MELEEISPNSVLAESSSIGISWSGRKAKTVWWSDFGSTAEDVNERPWDCRSSVLPDKHKLIHKWEIGGKKLWEMPPTNQTWFRNKKYQFNLKLETFIEKYEGSSLIMKFSSRRNLKCQLLFPLHQNDDDQWVFLLNKKVKVEKQRLSLNLSGEILWSLSSLCGLFSLFQEMHIW